MPRRQSWLGVGMETRQDDGLNLGYAEFEQLSGHALGYWDPTLRSPLELWL